MNLDRPAIRGRGASSELESQDRPAALAQQVAWGQQEDLAIPDRLACKVVVARQEAQVQLVAQDPGVTSELESQDRAAAQVQPVQQVNPAPLDQPDLRG